MSCIRSVVIVLALLCNSCLADKCDSGSPSCTLSQMEPEETSLLQVNKVTKTGKDRIEKRTQMNANKTELNATINHDRTSKSISLHDEKHVQDSTPEEEADGALDLPGSGELVQAATKEEAKVPVKNLAGDADTPPAGEDLAEEMENVKVKEATKVASVDDNSTSGTLSNDIEFKAGEQKEYVIPTVNKWLIVLLEALTLPALFGVDRCCMGQILLGVIKGVTLGGFFIWFVIDLFIIYWNAWFSYPNISFLGFDANWEPGTLVPAFWIALIGFILVFGASLVSSICVCIAKCTAKA